MEPAGRLSEGSIGEAELAALALAADPDAPLAPDAVPWLGAPIGLLPEWYMASTSGRSSSRARRFLALALVAGLVGGCALGLCVTSGWDQFA